MDAAKSVRVVRFGVFEVDFGNRELRKGGIRIRLQDQPFEVLEALLEKPGEVVTREELIRRIWGAEPPVDVNASLNKAVNKLRNALGDSTESPRFVETLVKRGYRFLAPVEVLEAEPAAPERGPEEAPGEAARAETERPEGIPRLRSRRGRLAVIASLAAAAVLAAVWAIRPEPPKVLRYRQLTADGLEKAGRVVYRDGRVYFSEFYGGRLTIAWAPADGGRTQRLPEEAHPGGNLFLLDVSLDGRRLLTKTTAGPGAELMAGPLWALHVSGEPPQRLGEMKATDARWSPDGRRLAIVNDDGVYLAGGNGENPRRLVTKPGLNYGVSWSPDGRRLRFVSQLSRVFHPTLWETTVEGARPEPVLPAWDREQGEGNWTPDGRYFLFRSPPDSTLWALREEEGFGGAGEEPSPLTTGAIRFNAPTVDPSGETLYAIGGIRRGELLRWNFQTEQFEPFLPGLSADQLDFSRDGARVTYISYPEGDLWCSRADGTERLQLTFSPMQTYLPRFSPDGEQIAFMGRMPGKKWKIHIVASTGGTPAELLPGEGPEADPNWSPDGTRIVFAPFPWDVPEEETGIRIYDFATQQVTALPDSQGLFSPRWSPDGRYIVALRSHSAGLMLYEIRSGSWRQLSDLPAGFPAWSSDSKHVYVYVPGGIYRVPVGGGESELIAPLTGVPLVGIEGPYGLSLGPGDRPIVVRDAGLHEVYALQVELP